MTIDTTKPIVDLDGKVIKDGEGEKDFTVGMAIGRQLASGKSLDPLKAWVLAQKFYTQPEVEVNAEQIVYIKDNFKETNFFTFIVGQVFEALEK